MCAKTPQTFEVKIDKLVHGGQGIGVLSGGKKALVWGVLPGELVLFNVTKNRSDYVEGVVLEVIKPSKLRIEPKDKSYLSTSPWQVLDYGYENLQKTEILAETFARASVDYSKKINFLAPKNDFYYRNKMEYSFFGDETGLHLALFDRGSHHKQIINGSSIARPEIDVVANEICRILDQNNVRAGDLKSLILRCNDSGEVVCALFVKTAEFLVLEELKNVPKGIIVVHSNPKSPASVRTKDLYKFGDISLSEIINGTKIYYDVFSFFQVNLEIFMLALDDISQAVNDDPVVDSYSGVGTIGLYLKNAVSLVEIDENNIFWAKKNAKNSNIKVIHASSEKALDCINPDNTYIVDPPRAGLHANLIQRFIDIKPPKIIYLSCNPSTQARDLNLLQPHYEIDQITGYNFFPRTPHIESLAVLIKKDV